MSHSTHPEKNERDNTERHNTSDSDNTSDTSTSNLPKISACLRLLQGMEHGPRGTKKASGFQATCPDRENQWRIQNERNLEMVAQEWMLDIASTNLLRNMSERSRLNNVTKNIPGISFAAVEAADAEQRWQDQNERDLEALAQASMLDAAVIKDVRDRSERALLFNKPKPKCLRDRAAIDNGASETMTNNLALVSNPVPADILVRQADGSCVPGQYLRGKLSAKSLCIALPRMDVIHNKNLLPHSCLHHNSTAWVWRLSYHQLSALSCNPKGPRAPSAYHIPTASVSIKTRTGHHSCCHQPTAAQGRGR